MKNHSMQTVSKTLGYSFNDLALLTKALTHRSFSNDHNERLEFLGDAIVNFIVAEILYHQFPHASEGDLSRFRASLVNRDSLGELARTLDLGRYLQLGQGEIKTGGSQRLSILSCAMEAIIGAIYLDGGFEATQTCVMRWYEPILKTLTHAASHKDPKTKLQEYCQQHQMTLPSYTVQSIEGEAHNQQFTILCHIEGITPTAVGQGTSRRRAEQAAAALLYEMIKP